MSCPLNLHTCRGVTTLLPRGHYMRFLQNYKNIILHGTYKEECETFSRLCYDRVKKTGDSEVRGTRAHSQSTLQKQY